MRPLRIKGCFFVTTEPVESRTATNATSGVGVLEKAMSVLNIVSAAALPMTFTELLRAGNLPKATLHRILATLMREGLLRFVQGNKTYQLGFRLLELAHEVWSDFDLRLAAQDEIANLRNSLGMSVHLAVLDRDSMVVVASQDAVRSLGDGAVLRRLLDELRREEAGADSAFKAAAAASVVAYEKCRKKKSDDSSASGGRGKD